MRASIDHELNFSVRSDVFWMAEERSHPVEMPPPLGAVAVVLSKKLSVVPGLAIPADCPGFVGPGEHEGNVGLAIFEHGFEGRIHDWIAKPVVMVSDAVDAAEVYV